MALSNVLLDEYTPAILLSNPQAATSMSGGTISCDSNTASGTIWYLVKDTPFTGTEAEQAAEIQSDGASQAAALTNQASITSQISGTRYYVGWVQNLSGGLSNVLLHDYTTFAVTLTNATNEPMGNGATIGCTSNTTAGMIWSYSKDTPFTGTEDDIIHEVVTNGVSQPAQLTNTRSITTQQPLTEHYVRWVQFPNATQGYPALHGSYKEGNAVRYGTIPKVTIPAGDNYRISWDGIRSDTATGNVSTKIMGMADNSFNVQIFDAGSVTPAQGRLRINNTNYDHTGVFLGVGQGDTYRCSVQVTGTSAKWTVNNEDISGTMTVTANGWQMDSIYRGDNSTGDYLPAGAAYNNLLIENLSTGESWHFPLDEGSGTVIYNADAGTGSAYDGVWSDAAGWQLGVSGRSNILPDSYTTLDQPVEPVLSTQYPSRTLYLNVKISPIDLGDPYWSSNAGPMTYAFASGSAPDGLSLSSDGILTGTPTVKAEYPERIVATNAIGPTTGNLFAINVVDAPVIVPTDGGGLMLNLTLRI